MLQQVAVAVGDEINNSLGPNPLDALVGNVVNGWQVIESHALDPEHSGGLFSRGYVVTKGGTRAFMKVLDMQGALEHGEPQALVDLTRLHSFETALLQYCEKQRMNNVVRLIESGKHTMAFDGRSHILYFLVMERGEGDVRARISEGFAHNFAWRFFTLHQIAVGLTQLHGKSISHLDVKPSNILEFPHEQILKLCDLGRSVSRHHPGPADGEAFPGDIRYAPLEYIYGHTPRDAVDQRQGSDAYLLGSMITFLFLGSGATNITLDETPDEALPLEDGPSVRFKDALPFLISAHARVTLRLKQMLPAYCSDELSVAYWQLCHPDPELRGHPKARSEAGKLPGINRYVSLFARLRAKAEHAERKSQS